MTTSRMPRRVLWPTLATCAMLPVVIASVPLQPSTPQPGGRLGIALSCGGCEAGRVAAGPLIVRAVAPDGPAQRLLAAGDTIVSVNGTITDPRAMREAMLRSPVDSALVFVVHGARGRYTVHVRKEAGRTRQVGAARLPVKYEGAFGAVGVEVLTNGAPVVSRDASGALLIRIGEHAVRLTETAR